MGAFTFKLEHDDGTSAEPPTLHTAVPNWRPGDTIPLGAGSTLRVVGVRAGAEPDDAPTLVVEERLADNREPLRFDS